MTIHSRTLRPSFRILHTTTSDESRILLESAFKNDRAKQTFGESNRVKLKAPELVSED